MTDTLARFNCPTCRTSYKWAAEAAGPKTRCKCGAVLRAPAQPGGFAELADKPAAAAAPSASAGPQQTPLRSRSRSEALSSRCPTSWDSPRQGPQKSK